MSRNNISRGASTKSRRNQSIDTGELNALDFPDALLTMLIAFDKTPLKRQLTILNEALEPFRTAIPVSDAKTLSSSDALRIIDSVTLVIECCLRAEVFRVIASDTTGILQRLVEKDWPNVIRWLGFLSENLGRFGFQSKCVKSVKDTGLSNQLLLATCTDFLRSACVVENLRRSIYTDAEIFMIITSFYLKQNAKLSFILEGEKELADWMHYSPSYIFYKVLLSHLENPPKTPDRRWDEVLNMVESRSRTITHIALQHLSLVLSLSTIRKINTIHKLKFLLTLIDIIGEVDAFLEHLRKPETIIIVVSVLQLCASSKNAGYLDTDSPSEDPHAFSNVFRGGMNILMRLFTDPYANKNMKIALKAGVGDVFAAMTHWLTVRPSMSHGEELGGFVRSGLIRLSMYTQYRTVVYKILGAMESAFRFQGNPKLEKNKTIGDHWTTLRCLALERAISRYLFDKAFQKTQYSCMLCHQRVSVIKTCSACETLRYCSKECQRESWNVGHKIECKSFQGTLPKKKSAEELSGTEGKRDPSFQKVIAAKDIQRHSISILKLIRDTYPAIPPTEVLVGINYTVRDFRPMITVNQAPPGATDELDAHWLPLLQPPDAPVKMKLVYVRSLVMNGNDVKPRTFPIDIAELTEVDPAFLDYLYKEPYSEEHPFKRSVLQTADGTYLKPRRDDIDDILSQFWVLSKVHPGWSIWKRIKAAVREVERVAVDEGRNLYDGWI